MDTSSMVIRLANSGRRRLRLARGLALGVVPGVHVGRRVQVGAGVRLRIEPGGKLTLGDNCEIDDGVTLAVSAGGHLHLGPGVFVGHHATLAARELLEINEGTFLAELVSIRDHDHSPDSRPSSGHNIVAPVIIGRDCWLASKVTVTRGVTIGDRTVVGANAVVTTDLGCGVVAVGVPARTLDAGRKPPTTAQ